MHGKIIKGVGGLYTVVNSENRSFACKAKGIFRKKGVSPLIGDNVIFEALSEEEGNIIEIKERKNTLIRPACANVDQVLVIFAAVSPEPNLNLLDRFLIMMQKQNIDAVLCFNKTDIADDMRLHLLAQNYESSGVRIIFISVKNEEGIEEVSSVLKGKTTILAGPSGVGKSSLMNMLAPFCNMEVGALSERIGRGKQTTRHTELIEIDRDTFLCDSPGFSSIYIEGIDYRELKGYFPEFDRYAGECRFLSCTHTSEPDCAVKKAVESGCISKNRYENYCSLFNELKKNRKK